MYGLKQNLELVYAPCEKGEYRIVAGERRWEALKYLVSKGYKEFELATSKLTTPQDNDEEQVEIIIANAYRTKTTSDMIEEETRLKASLDWQVFRFEYPVMKDGKPVLDENRKQVTKGRMLDFMGFQFHHDRTTIRKSNIEAARRKANHISKQDKISWYNASVMLSYMGLFKHTDTYNYYIEYIKPKINVKKLKRIVSKHSRKENEQHDRLEKGDRNTAGTSGGNRQDIVSVNGLSA